MRRLSPLSSRIGASSRFVILGWLVVVGMILAAGGLVVSRLGNGSQATFARIAADCRSSVDALGAGRAVLTGETRLQNVTGEIGVPCRLFLEQGAQLTIGGSHLRTQGLTISNEWPVSVLHESFSAVRADQGGCCVPNPDDLTTVVHSNVTIEDSSVTGVGDTALTILLGSADDVFTISDSHVDYPFGVLANVGSRAAVGKVDGGGRIKVDRSRVQATGDGSFGIVLATSAPGGQTLVANDQFEVVREALVVYGPTCVANSVPGLDPDCRTQHARKPTPTPPGGNSQNYAAGNVQIQWSGNACVTDVSFAVTSDPNGANASGTISATVVPAAHCSGELKGRITCLIVSGNHAVFGGVVTHATDVLDEGNVVFGAVTQNPPRPDGESADNADFYEMGSLTGEGSCPPLETGRGWRVLEGTVIVHQAYTA
jgi:hypothetical protein